MIEEIITSKTRRKILNLFLSNEKSSFYVREIERKINENINSIRKELVKMEKIGFLVKETIANSLFYNVNKDFLLYKELKSIIDKTNPYTILLSDLEDIVKIKIKNLTSIILFGSVARNEMHNDSDVDIMIIADNLPKDWRKRDKLSLEIEKIGFKYGISVHTELISKKEFLFSVENGAPLLFELSKDYKIIYDVGFFKKQISKFKQNMRMWDAKKTQDNVWEVPKLAIKV